MGTETLAPLLYYLTRFTRARFVLEGGTGYTTPFLAMALAKNKLDFITEREALRRKTDIYLAAIGSTIASDPQSSVVERPLSKLPVGLSALYSEKSSNLAQRRFEWLLENPSWARPGYYLQPYDPQLFSVDNLSDAASSAPVSHRIIERLGLSDYVTFHNVDFWTFKPQLHCAEHMPFDLIWVDLTVGVRGAMNLLQRDYWNCLRPDGGLLIIHDMMTTRGGQLLVNEFKKLQENARFADFEMVGFLEPQRLMQGDFILIRKTSGKKIAPVDDIIQPPGRDVLEKEAEALMKRLTH